jgi:hypothetical protein
MWKIGGDKAPARGKGKGAAGPNGGIPWMGVERFPHGDVLHYRSDARVKRRMQYVTTRREQSYACR